MPTLGDMKYTFRNGEESSTNLTESELEEKIIDIVKSNLECSFRWVNETLLVTE